MVELQSKILQSVLKAFKVEPTVPGIITAAGGDPEKVFELIRFVQANGERLTQSFEAAVIGTAERVQRMEAAQDVQRAMLCAIMHKLEISHSEVLRRCSVPPASQIAHSPAE